MTTPTIRRLRARCVKVPVKRPPMSASGALPDMALVLVDLETQEGLTGRSYLFAFAPWTFAPIVGCLQAMADLVDGDAVAPFELDAKLEYMDWAAPILTKPLAIKNGHAIIPDRPGSGIAWDEDAVKRYAA